MRGVIIGSQTISLLSGLVFEMEVFLCDQQEVGVEAIVLHGMGRQ